MEVLILEVACLVPPCDPLHLSCSLKKMRTSWPRSLSPKLVGAHMHMHIYPFWQGLFTPVSCATSLSSLLNYLHLGLETNNSKVYYISGEMYHLSICILQKKSLRQLYT